jgi:hypothetical protein
MTSHSIATKLRKILHATPATFEQAIDWAHESADGSEYAIYYYKAHTLCQTCNIEQGEDFFSECYGGEHGKSYDDIACIMAYGEINARICARLWQIFEEREEEAA